MRPLWFGGDFHKLLELRNDPKELKLAKKDIKEKFYEMPPNWQSDIGDNYLQDLREIFGDYLKVYRDTPQPHETEHPFEIRLGSYKGEPVIFNGIIDELYKYKQKGEKFIILGEHKTFSKAPDMNTLMMNTQISLYAMATLLETGILPKEVIWDYIKSTPAKRPIWLEKSDRFSIANSKDITKFSWDRACREKGITDKTLIDQGNIYMGNELNFFKRFQLTLNQQMVESIWDGFVYTCKQIVKQGHTNKTKNVTKDCSWCNYRDICFAEFTGADTKYLLEKNYEVKEIPIEEVEESVIE